MNWLEIIGIISLVGIALNLIMIVFISSREKNWPPWFFYFIALVPFAIAVGGAAVLYQDKYGRF